MRYQGASGSRLPLIVGAVILAIALVIVWYVFFA
jgi:hypothetical protein